MSRKEKQLTIPLRANASSSLGKLIEYLQNEPLDIQAQAIETLTMRFLPLALDYHDKDFRKISLRCAVMCESWARLIRENAGLPPSCVGLQRSQYNVIPNSNGIETSQSVPAPVPVEELEPLPSDDNDDDDELEDQRHQQRRARMKKHLGNAW